MTGTAPLGGGSGCSMRSRCPASATCSRSTRASRASASTLGGKTRAAPAARARRAEAARRRSGPSAALPDFAMGVDLDEDRARCSRARAGVPRPDRPRRAVPVPHRHVRRAPAASTRDAAAAAVPRDPGAAARCRRQALRDAALDGGRFLVAHLAPNGRYIYEHDLATGAQTDPTRAASYSHAAPRRHHVLPRRAVPDHEGAVAARADRARVRAPRRAAGDRAAARGTLPDGTDDRLRDRPRRDASRSSARRRSPSSRSPSTSARPATRATCRSRRSSRRGSCTCSAPTARSATSTTRRRKQPDDKTELLYYSGEAALALARMHVDHRRGAVRGGRRAGARLARRLVRLLHGRLLLRRGALDVHRRRGDLAGREERDKYTRVLPRLRRVPARSSRPQVGEHPDEDDFAGAYNFTPFVVPYNTPAGSRTEAMISAYLLGRAPRHARSRRRARQIRRGAAVRARPADPARQRLRRRSAPASAACRASPIDRNVRIDYVQHVCSAMIRASEWIDEP